MTDLATKNEADGGVEPSAFADATATTAATAVLDHPERSAEQIFGGIDAMKLRSSMTLFARAEGKQSVFDHVLDRFFPGPDEATERLLGAG